MNDRVREILSWYEHENPGVRANLARILNHGKLGGTGKFVILPVDQGFEHGPARSFAPNPAGYNPMYHAELAIEERETPFSERIQAGYRAVTDIVSKVWIYIAIGIAVGAGVHGYVPENFMASLMGKSAWWSVPLAVLIGVPLYSNAAGIIPVMQALLEKGASLGTSLAFMMSVIGLSLPEMIILKRVVKLPLILIFIGVVASGIMLVGYLFNMIY